MRSETTKRQKRRRLHGVFPAKIKKSDGMMTNVIAMACGDRFSAAVPDKGIDGQFRRNELLSGESAHGCERQCFGSGFPGFNISGMNWYETIPPTNSDMRIYKSLLLQLGAVCLAASLQAQNFTNLDFESANLTPVPAGQFGGEVSVSNALPGWTAYIGTDQLTQVLQNNVTLGAASVDMLGPDWNSGYGAVIEGQYSVELQPGQSGGGGIPPNVSASISQTGLVPANTLSLQFKAATLSSFTVSLGGQDLSLVTLGTGQTAANADYTLYGADVSPFAGRVEALTITALAAPNTFDCFDSFVFSTSPVPEPGTWALMICGGTGLWLKVRRLKAKG